MQKSKGKTVWFLIPKKEYHNRVLILNLCSQSCKRFIAGNIVKINWSVISLIASHHKCNTRKQRVGKSSNQYSVIFHK